MAKSMLAHAHVIGSCMALAGLAPAFGCAEPAAIVDLQWVFVDRAQELSVCHLQGFDPTSGRFVKYALRPRIRLFACADRQDAAACLAEDPVVEKIFTCGAKRGTIAEVPAFAQPYLIDVDVLVDLGDPTALPAKADCVARPGPRWRHVRGGILVDLAVYQFVVDQAAATADLRACLVQ